MGWLKDLTAKPFASLKVLLKAWPTWAAAITGVLTAIGVEVIPHLPGEWAVEVGAWIAYGLAVLAAVSAAVARVTPILFPSEEGLLPLPEAPALEFDPQRLQTYDPPTPSMRGRVYDEAAAAWEAQKEQETRLPRRPPFGDDPRQTS